MSVEARARAMRDDAELAAWKALAGYKFWMFGYHAAAWVRANRLLGDRAPNPFRGLVHAARAHLKAQGIPR